MSRSFFSSERTFEELSDAISSADPSIRWAALLELGTRSEGWAKKLIASCLDDSDDTVATAAHDELGISFPSRPLASARTKQAKAINARASLSEAFETRFSQLNWALTPSPIALELSLRRIAFNSRHLVSTTQSPFPQADSFERVLQIVSLTNQGTRDVQDLVSKLGVDERQVHYYLAAAKYLGLLAESQGAVEVPSNVNKALFDIEVDPASLFSLAASAIVSVPSIANTFLEWNAQIPSLDRQVSIEALRMSEAGATLSESTLLRRARTVHAWAWWVRRNLNVMQELWTFNEFFRQVPLPNFERALATIHRLGEREIECLSRNNNIFVSASGKSLDDIGRAFDLSRERVRQIEKKARTRVLEDIDRETNWDWKSDLASFLRENLTFDSANVIFEILSGKIGEAITTMLFAELNCTQIGKSKRFWTIDENEVAHRLDKLRASTPMLLSAWIENVYQASLSPQFVLEEIEVFSIVDGVVIDRKKRREQIVKYHLSQVVSAHEQELAAFCGEPPSRAFSEALRRSGTFVKNHLSGHWQIAESRENPSARQFSNVYDAVIYVLETFGPMHTAELVTRMEDLYPVSYARIIQALDHGSIGRLCDGRAALMSQGASRTRDEEPKLPLTGLWEENSEIFVHKLVDDAVVRGSGFILPRWLQWRFGLTATPEFVRFSATDNTEKDFVITRRGGQALASSIRDSLEGNEVARGCQLAIVLNPEKLTWRILHKHESCH